MKIWLDDMQNDFETNRTVPNGYIGAFSVNEVKKLVEQAESNGEVIEELNLDNDLGKYEEDGGEGWKVVYWLAERQTYYKVVPHTSNPIARERMMSLIERYWPR